MTLKNAVSEAIKRAMKEKDKETLASLRQLKSTIQNEEIKLQKELTEDEELTIVTREVKQTKEELEGYQKATGDYGAFIDKLENRIEVLQTYLPKQLTAEEVAEVVQAAITEVGASSKADMGKVMGVIMPKLKGKADGKLINQTVGKLLAN